MFLLLAISVLVILGSNAADENEITALYECDFEKDNCGFVNVQLLKNRWERKLLELGGRKSHVMAVVPSSGSLRLTARMQTPFFEINRTLKGCLNFDLYMNGEGVKLFRVLFQDGTGLKVILKSFTKSENWQSQSLALTVEDFAKLTFDGATANNGQIAVDNFVFKLGTC